MNCILRKNRDDDQIDDAWNAMLLSVPESTFELLENIGKQKRIFLLSNTNRIHITAFSKIIEKQYGFQKFEALFEKTYYSCNIGMRKPHAEIFEYVVKQNNLTISETLFIDDSPQHVEGARKYGLTALHLQNDTRVEDLIPLKWKCGGGSGGGSGCNVLIIIKSDFASKWKCGSGGGGNVELT